MELPEVDSPEAAGAGRPLCLEQQEELLDAPAQGFAELPAPLETGFNRDSIYADHD